VRLHHVANYLTCALACVSKQKERPFIPASSERCPVAKSGDQTTHAQRIRPFAITHKSSPFRGIDTLSRRLLLISTQSDRGHFLEAAGSEDLPHQIGCGCEVLEGGKPSRQKQSLTTVL